MASFNLPRKKIIFFPEAEIVEDNYGSTEPIGRQMLPDIQARIAWDMKFLESLDIGRKK